MFEKLTNDYEYGLTNSSSDLYDEIRSVISQVYIKHGYIDMNSTNEIDEKYTRNSIYIYAKNVIDKKIVGTLRLISFDDKHELPIFKEFDLFVNELNEINSIYDKEIVEIGRLAVIHGHNVADDLYRLCWQHSISIGYKYWLVSVDKRLFEMFRRIKGLSFRKFGKEKHFMGSITVPALATLEELACSMKEINPTFYEYMNNPMLILDNAVL